MKKYRKTNLINEMKQMLNKDNEKRLTVESMVFDDNIDPTSIEMNNPGYDGGGSEYDNFPQLPEQEVENITPTLNQIRSIVIQGLAKLAEHPDTPQYDTLKKIWQLIDKTVETKQPTDKPKQNESFRKRRSNLIVEVEGDFESQFNDVRNNSQKPLFGFEMKNSEGEWEYGDIEYDPNSQTMTCMGATIDVDPEMSVDSNIEALYNELMEMGYTDE